jgi:hypothetical protein
VGKAKIQQNQAAPTHLYTYKTRFSMLGTVGSGKSTIAGAIVLTSQTLSSDLPGFTCRVLEGTSNILSDCSNLRRGRFPAKTVPFGKYASEAGLLMGWHQIWGDKRVQVPICDIAGEDIQMMIRQYSHNMQGIGNAAYSAAMNLVNYVKDSDGFVLAMPASKALIHKDDAQIEAEAESVDFDPDVNLARILGEVIDHKERCRGKPIRGIAVVITKWDMLMPYAQNLGMDVFTEQGLREFMDVCFPSTSQQIKACKLANVQYFPSYIDVERDQDGNVKKWEKDGSPKIMVKDRRKPSYSEQSYVNLIEFLHGFAS